MTYTYPNQAYTVLNSIQASGADLTMVNRQINLGNPLAPVCLFNDLIKATVTVAVAEQLQVTTLTPTAAANSTYTFFIQQVNPATGNMTTVNLSYTTAASGDTATTIGDYFRSLINADPTLHIAATGTTTLILTAETGYAIFTVSITQLGGGLTQSTGTAGIQAVGTTAALAVQGVTTDINSASSYTTIVMKWVPKSGDNIREPIGVPQTLTVYLLESATNYAALVAKFRYVLAGRSVSITSAAAPEINDFGT